MYGVMQIGTPLARNDDRNTNTQQLMLVSFLPEKNFLGKVVQDFYKLDVEEPTVKEH